MLRAGSARGIFRGVEEARPGLGYAGTSEAEPVVPCHRFDEPPPVHRWRGS